MTDPIEIIDTRMHGLAGITGCFLIRGERTALVESGPESSLPHVLAGLERLGVGSLDWLIVTHIHLDHAGAAGALAQRFPDARVAVHEVGAPHLVDPSKLWSSAARIYGDRMDELWGGITPIAQERIRALRDGDEIDLGGRRLTAIDTPGHARHHHSYLDEATGTIFTGDAAGVRLPDIGVTRPATPPPEFHLEDAVASIRRLQDLAPERLCLTHFGPTDEGTSPLSPSNACEASIEALERWAEWISAARRKSRDIDEVAAVVHARTVEHLRGRLPDQALAKMEQTTSDRMNTWGYMRYFDKQEEREG